MSFKKLQFSASINLKIEDMQFTFTILEAIELRDVLNMDVIYQLNKNQALELKEILNNKIPYELIPKIKNTKSIKNMWILIDGRWMKGKTSIPDRTVKKVESYITDKWQDKLRIARKVKFTPGYVTKCLRILKQETKIDLKEKPIRVKKKSNLRA